MNNKKGLFITIDGVDGVGKTTTCALLAQRLNAASFKSPSEPFLSTRYMVDSNVEPLTRYFFFRAATQNDSKKIEQILHSGTSVVCDRYIYSTYAYHATMNPVIDKIFEKTELAEPDLSILLTAPSGVRKNRLAQRKAANQEYDRLLENNSAYQDAVQVFFQNLNMFEVDTEQNTPKQVVDIIVQKVISDFRI